MVNALQRLWNDKMAVTEYQKADMPDKSTGFSEVIVLENVPCKLSFSTLSYVQQGDAEARVAQTVKLLLDNAIEIKPGSKITVHRGSRFFEYSQSGLPGFFMRHQEITLVPFKGWV